MEKIWLSNEERIISKVNNVFDLSVSANFLNKSDYGILILLNFIKANDWPKKGDILKNDNPDKINILWAFFYSPNHDDILMLYDIHPMKCFPSNYLKYNNKSTLYPIKIRKEHKSGKEVTPGGCRNIVHINEREYLILEENPTYCSIFGIPNDCYDSHFENRMQQCLKKLRGLTCWCFKKNEYMNKHIEDFLDIKYMKSEFLPTKHYLYSDPASRFLKAIFTGSELKDINQENFYPSGKELIEEMNFDNKYGFLYEEEALYFIKKRLIFEFIKELLLLQNIEKFSSFSKNGLPFKYENNQEISQEIQKIIRKVEEETNFYINHIYNEIKRNYILDEEKLKTSRFLIMDVEYLPVSYPTDREGALNFPCIFSNIIWEGVRKGFTTEINIFSLPCHGCEIYCKVTKNNTLKFDCIIDAGEFINKQITRVEELLMAYSGFKMYTYGKSDIHQLEQAEHFFSDSDEFLRFKRRDRKRLKRLVDIADDIAVEGKSLEKIEIGIIERWLQGWSRRSDHIHKNKRFITKYGSKNWEKNYLEAINASIDDTISALLLLIHEQYILSDKSIQYSVPKTLEDYI